MIFRERKWKKINKNGERVCVGFDIFYYMAKWSFDSVLSEGIMVILVCNRSYVKGGT